MLEKMLGALGKGRDDHRTSGDKQAAAAADAAGSVEPGGRSSDSSLEIHDPRRPRYEIRERVASGSEGHVYVVADRALRRKVAMKVLRRELADVPKRQLRFLGEARYTSALEHPSIPAIYDVGVNEEGAPYFTMRLVRGRTLRDILRGLRNGDAEVEAEWTTHRLVQVLLQITHAVSFAHTQGLLHRDLKPANIAVGEHGDVQVLDWGLAKRVLDDDAATLVEDEDTEFTAAETHVGALVGTPLYMAPEQAECLHDLDGRTDVFALGGLLYEILCLQAPHKGGSVKDVVRAARRCEIEPPGVRNPGCNPPEVLVETAMRALAKSPADRHQTAAEFAHELQGFLEGTRQYAERRGRAKTLLSKALDLLGRSRRASEEANLHASEADVLRQATPAWASPEDKRALWQAEDLAGLQRVNAAHLFGRAMDRVARALALDPDDKTARRFMAKICYERFVQACRDGNEVEKAWFHHQVRRHDDGELGHLLRDVGTLQITANVEGATVALVRFVEKDRHLVPTERDELGSAPCMRGDVPSGSHLLVVGAPGHAEARMPVRVERGETTEVHVELIAADAVPPGFVYVPPGPFQAGPCDDLQEQELPGFLVARDPVRLSDYACWLDELLATDPGRVRAHVPFAETHGRLLVAVDGKHVFADASPIAERPIEAHDELPVVGVTRDSAEDYCTWLGARLGRTARLPHPLEWEKAARGTDGRPYPWGERFDATFCSMAESTEETPNLRPIGAFPVDVSPYGVRDLAGGVSEWCAGDIRAERSWAISRGGGWHLRAADCALDRRALIDRGTKSPGLGFRVVLPLVRDDADTDEGEERDA